MPSVNRLHQDFKAQGFELLLISFREGPEAVRKLMNEERYTAPVLLDPSGDIAGKVYGVWGPGTKFFIDRQGQLIGRHVGPWDWNSPASRTFIRELIATEKQ